MLLFVVRFPVSVGLQAGRGGKIKLFSFFKVGKGQVWLFGSE